MSMVVCLPSVMPESPLGVKVTWYFITCGEELVTRTSEWNVELMPSAWATAGMISASGGGVLFGVGCAGETRLTEMVVVPELAPFAVRWPELDGVLVVMVMPP